MTTAETIGIIYGFINLVILCITVYVISHSPVNAVRVGRLLNTEQQKDNAKRNLFLMLFALRGSPVNFDFVRGLNQIDIVFEDVQTVLDAWHIHYDSLQIKGQVNENQIWSLQRANLLSAMAVHLGYHRIRQTDMIRDYYPEGHDFRYQRDEVFRAANLDFFVKGAEVYQLIIDKSNEPPKDTVAKTD